MARYKRHILQAHDVRRGPYRSAANAYPRGAGARVGRRPLRRILRNGCKGASSANSEVRQEQGGDDEVITTRRSPDTCFSIAGICPRGRVAGTVGNPYASAVRRARQRGKHHVSFTTPGRGAGWKRMSPRPASDDPSRHHQSLIALLRNDEGAANQSLSAVVWTPRGSPAQAPARRWKRSDGSPVTRRQWRELPRSREVAPPCAPRDFPIWAGLA